MLYWNLDVLVQDCTGRMLHDPMHAQRRNVFKRPDMHHNSYGYMDMANRWWHVAKPSRPGGEGHFWTFIIFGKRKLWFLLFPSSIIFTNELDRPATIATFKRAGGCSAIDTCRDVRHANGCKAKSERQKISTQSPRCVEKLYAVATFTMTCAYLMTTGFRSSNLFFWNKHYLPSKGIESWTLPQT